MKKIFLQVFLLFAVGIFACEYDNPTPYFKVSSYGLPYISSVNGISCIGIYSYGSWGNGTIETNAPLKIWIDRYDESFYMPETLSVRQVGFMRGGIFMQDVGYTAWGKENIPLKLTFYYRIDGGKWNAVKGVYFSNAEQNTLKGSYIELDIDIASEVSVVDLVLFAGTDHSIFSGLSGPGISSLDGLLTVPPGDFREIDELVGGSSHDDLEDQVLSASFYSHVQLKMSKHKRPTWK